MSIVCMVPREYRTPLSCEFEPNHFEAMTTPLHTPSVASVHRRPTTRQQRSTAHFRIVELSKPPAKSPGDDYPRGLVYRSDRLPLLSMTPIIASAPCTTKGIAAGDQIFDIYPSQVESIPRLILQNQTRRVVNRSKRPIKTIRYR